MGRGTSAGRPRATAALLVVGAILAKGIASAAVFDVHETGLGTPLLPGELSAPRP